MNFHLPKTIKSSNLVYENRLIKTQQEPAFVDNNANYIISQKPSMPVMMNQPINPVMVSRSVSP